MAIIIKACSLCRPVVREKLVKAKISHEEKKDTNKDTSSFIIEIASPGTYTPNSLAALCWNALRFPYHHADKKGNAVACSNV
jgi:hypothetical protein